MNILFVTTSFVYSSIGGAMSFHDQFVRLAQIGRKDITVEVTAIGGGTLGQHWRDTKGINAQEEIRTGNYDLVIMNGGYVSDLNSAGVQLSNLAKANGAQPMFWGLWSPDNQIGPNGAGTFIEDYHRAYKNAAVANDGAYSPVGLVYRKAYDWLHAKYGNGDNGQTVEDMLTADNIHGANYANFIGAATLYATIFGEHPPTSWTPPGVSTADMRMMADLAWTTSRAEGIAPSGAVLPAPSTPSAPSAPAPAPAPSTPTAPDPVADTGEVRGRVFVDTNNNDREDSRDTGAAGLRVELISRSGAVVDRVTTDANGQYVFAGVDEGFYRVRVTVQRGQEFVTPNQAADTVDSDILSSTATTGLSSQFRVTAGGLTLDIDAGLLPAAASPAPAPAPTPAPAPSGRTGAVSGRVFLDSDADGRETGESGLEGHVIRLWSPTRGVVQSTETDANGDYTFTGIAPGLYFVRVDVEDDQLFSPAGRGGEAIDSDIVNHWTNANRGQTDEIVVVAGGHVVDVDAGVVEGRPASGGAGGGGGQSGNQNSNQSGSVSGRVFVDRDGDGVDDRGEAGSGGLLVRLWDDARGVVQFTRTDADGSYHFNNVAPGDYKIRIDAGRGVEFTPNTNGDNDVSTYIARFGRGETDLLTVRPGQDVTGVDAGVLPSWMSAASLTLSAGQGGSGQSTGGQSTGGQASGGQTWGGSSNQGSQGNTTEVPSGGSGSGSAPSSGGAFPVPTPVETAYEPFFQRFGGSQPEALAPSLPEPEPEVSHALPVFGWGAADSLIFA
ncbi:hypothetical protein HKCCE2091_11030 [Rhodobacterales bacterium HKCCE2091]|nr:hypothetical protein [Rhodobacterales bacterium HKCCE2091]